MSQTDRSTIVSIFNDESQAERAIGALRAAGIPDQYIGMVKPEEHDATAGIRDRLVNLGVPEQQAAYYQRELESGRTLVAVHADDQFELSSATLRRHGGFDWSSRSADSILTSERVPGEPDEPAIASDATDDQRIQLHEERLVGETTRGEAGEVVVRKVLEEVPVRRTVDRDIDGVDVERVRVGEVVQERRRPWNEGDTIVVPLYEERLVVQRQLVLSEQLRIRRVHRTEQQEITGTIRRERAVIDDPGQFVEEHDTDTRLDSTHDQANQDESRHR